MIERDTDKLATVLGHEAAHVLARHSAEGVGLRLLLAGTGWILCSFLRTFTSNARKSYRCAAHAPDYLAVPGSMPFSKDCDGQDGSRNLSCSKCHDMQLTKLQHPSCVAASDCFKGDNAFCMLAMFGDCSQWRHAQQPLAEECMVCCREQQLAKALKDVESQYQKGTRNYNLAVQQVQQKHQGSSVSSEEAEELMRKLADRSTQVGS